MGVSSATAISHPNIAFIKYWGNRDHQLRLPANGSISMTLGGLETVTTVAFDPTLNADQTTINGMPASPETQLRVSDHLRLIRALADPLPHAQVDSESNFPIGAGLASSASAFASLTLAAAEAAGLELGPLELSRLARRGSGSASRSILGGFVELNTGGSDQDGYAQQIASVEHWGLVDWIALIEGQPKAVGSSRGHALADSSPLQPIRLAEANRRLDACREAIRSKDFEQLARIVELDCNLMHAVMMTSTPPLLYWTSRSLEIMRAVSSWRKDGLPVCYTVDAGPNVHCLCPQEVSEEVGLRLLTLDGSLDLIQAGMGGPTRLVGT